MDDDKHTEVHTSCFILFKQAFKHFFFLHFGYNFLNFLVVYIPRGYRGRINKNGATYGSGARRFGEKSQHPIYVQKLL